MADRPGTGLWYRVDEELHTVHYLAAQRDGAARREYLRQAVVGGWREIPDDAGTFVLTLAPEAEPAWRWRAWRVVGDQALPLALDVFDPQGDVLSPLAEHWPVVDLSTEQIMVVGVGVPPAMRSEPTAHASSCSSTRMASDPITSPATSWAATKSGA